MAVIKGTFYADSLSKLTHYTAILPEKRYEEVAVLYLLHGRSGDANSWLNQTGIVRYLSDLPLAVFCLEGDLSYYQNMVLGADYWTYLTEEFPRKMAQFHPYSVSKEFVAGNSMGEYGALSWLLAEPQRFTAVGLLSPLVDPQRLLSVLAGTDKELQAAFGTTELTRSPANLLNRVSQLRSSTKLYHSCGDQDFLYADSLKLQACLDNQPLDYECHHGQGGHDWPEWDLEVQHLIKRISNVL